MSGAGVQLVYDAHGRELRVTSMRRRGWIAGDDADELEDATIVCPMVVDIEGGGRLHTLLVEKLESDGARRRVVVYWCRYLNAFRTLNPEAYTIGREDFEAAQRRAREVKP